MANCGLLLNDGSSFVILNAGGVLLLNDTSCGTEAGISEAALSATGTGTGSLVGSALSDAIISASGEWTGVFISPTPDTTTPTPSGPGGVGRLSGVWRRAPTPPWLNVDDSAEYRRLKRKLAMLEEHLLDARRSEIDAIERKISEVKRQMELL
jgi:hypothetical protein